MKEGTRESPRQELQWLLTERKNQELVDYAEQAKNLLLSDWLEGRTESVRSRLRYESALLTYAALFLQELDESRYAALRLGALLGAVESFERILFEQNQNLWAEARFTKEPVKHLPEIVQALETHGPMSHTDLGNYLGIKPPTLTEAMKKVLNTGAIQVSMIGKYKVYTLSDSGLRYGKELRKRKKQDFSLKDLCEKLDMLLRYAENEGSREYIKSTVMRQLRDEPAVDIYSGDTVQFQASNYPQKIIFSVDSFLNAIGSREKILRGRLESDLESTTNVKSDRQLPKSSKENVQKYFEERSA